MRNHLNSARVACVALVLVGAPLIAQGQLFPPRFADVQPGAGGLQLSWAVPGQQGDAGEAFSLQYKDDLRDLIWRVPSKEPYPLFTNKFFDTELGTKARFYRLHTVPKGSRGRLVSATSGGSYTTAFLSFVFGFGGIPVTPQRDVQAWKIVYETIQPDGSPTLASGVLALPLGLTTPLPLASYQHGTILLTNKAPTSMDLQTEVSIAIVFATTGYAAVAPDYLGLGEGTGLHPYHHARSEASACVDLLRAARSFCATNGVTLTNRLFLAGYSQGGHATMALLREMEWFHTNEFNVAACAAMAGAYDMSGTTAADFLSGRAQPNPYYFLYLLASYQNTYGLAGSLKDLLASPYDVTLPPLLNGATDSSVINAKMPSDPTQILTPEVLAAFRADPRHPLRLALEENDLYRWKPVSPLRLYHCSGDQDVVVENSLVALESFHALGATNVVLLQPVPNGTHSTCAQPSMLDAKNWFDSLR